MKFLNLLIISMLLFSCHKNGTFTEISPITSQDSAQIIYVTAAKNFSNFSTLYAYETNRQKRWEVANITELWSQKAYNDNYLYMSMDERIYCLNAETGAVKWTYGGGNQSLVQPKLQGDTLLTAFTQIAPSPTNELILLNKHTGALLWNKVVTDQPLIPPVLSEGKIYSLTTNGTGTQINLTAYDLLTQTQVWQKQVAAGFLMSVPPEMILRSDTLIVGAFTNLITSMNKNTGAIYWSKNLYTQQSFLVNGEIIYNDQDCGCVKKISLQTGATTFQGQPVYRTRFDGQSYVYDNYFYNRVYDSLFRTSLVDGSVRRTKVADDYFKKLILVGKTVYASKVDFALNDQSRIMMLQADDLIPKDSIQIPAQYINDFSILSAAKHFY